jgi:hypothetical protein
MNRWMIYSTCSIFAFCSVGTIATPASGAELDAIPSTDATDLGDGPFGDAAAKPIPRPTGA